MRYHVNMLACAQMVEPKTVLLGICRCIPVDGMQRAGEEDKNGGHKDQGFFQIHRISIIKFAPSDASEQPLKFVIQESRPNGWRRMIDTLLRGQQHLGIEESLPLSSLMLKFDTV